MKGRKHKAEQMLVRMEGVQDAARKSGSRQNSSIDLLA
jgi:hypothetical protein